jgi:hypothetical protein
LNDKAEYWLKAVENPMIYAGFRSERDMLFTERRMWFSAEIAMRFAAAFPIASTAELHCEDQ